MNNSRAKLFIRIICIVIAAMMVLGAVVSIIPMGSEAYGNLYEADMTVAIGVAYGASAPKSYTVEAPDGFELGYLHEGTFTALHSLPNKVITLKGKADAGYKVHIPVDESAADFTVQYAELSAIGAELGVLTYRAFVGKSSCVRMGAYTTYAEAQAVCEALSSHGVYSYVYMPSDSEITVLDDTGKRVFSYDCGTDPYLALRAIQPANGSYYITAPDGNAYEGVMRFNRYNDGMTVVSVLPIEDYVAGVLPYEISSGWNAETQKAFAVCVRSYTLTNLGKHKKNYGFDLCNTTDCQVYRGVGRITDKVRQCVSETKSMVLTYKGRPVGAYYSSSTGGCTAGAYDVWGGTSFPYLSAAATPWEKYTEHSGGSWTAEVSPAELYNTLKRKGYNTLTGDIASIEINSFAQNSTYVSSITFTDVNGNKATVNKCDKVRMALSTYVRSANFVVGRAGEQVSVTDYVSSAGALEPTEVEGYAVATPYGQKVFSEEALDTSGKSVITSRGIMPIEDIRTTDSVMPDILDADIKVQTRTVTLQGKAGNFVFVGRGYGHGVGMSQYGAKDLGDMGYTYDVILSSYFPLTEITNMTNIK